MTISIKRYPAVIETALGTVTTNRLAWIIADDETRHIIAYCVTEEDAKRILAALEAPASPPTPTSPTTTTVHLHVDGRELAKAVVPHLHSAIRNAAGARNF